ncbi:MAG: hypothetical protein JNL98_29165 [Bryobacterales bacterium]|nr:hypothetical protein [Bryobacterales bacterium]
MGSSPEVRGTENRICGFPIRAFLLIFVLSFAIRAVLLALWAAGHPDFLHF